MSSLVEVGEYGGPQVPTFVQRPVAPQRFSM